MTFIEKPPPSFLERRLPDAALAIYVLAATIGAFSGGLWAGLGIASGIIFYAAVWLSVRKIPRLQPDLASLTFAFLATVAVMNLRSSQPGISWHEWGRLCTVFIPMLLLLSPYVAARAAHARLFNVLPVAIALGGVALAGWLYTHQPDVPTIEKLHELAKYNRGFSYLVLLAFPVMAALWLSKRRWLIAPFLIVLLIPAGMTESRSAKLALIAGLAVIIAAYLAPVLIRRLLAAATFVTVGWPFAAREIFHTYFEKLPQIPPSWRARLEIWDYMSYRIQERPWLGWGLGTSHTLDFLHPDGASYVFTTWPAAHPHNVMIQLWAELGLPGLALGIAFALLTLCKAARLDARLVPFALGCWAACFCLNLIAYDIWTDSLFAAFALTAMAFVMLQRQITLRPSTGATADRK